MHAPFRGDDGFPKQHTYDGEGPADQLHHADALPERQGGDEAHRGHQVDVERSRARQRVPQGVGPQEYRQGPEATAPR